MIQFVTKYCQSRRAMIPMAALALAAATIVVLGTGCELKPILVPEECVDAGAQGGGGSGGAGGGAAVCKH